MKIDNTIKEYSKAAKNLLEKVMATLDDGIYDESKSKNIDEAMADTKLASGMLKEIQKGLLLVRLQGMLNAS